MDNLFDYLVETVEINGKEYELDLWFDTVLRFFDLMKNDEFTDAEKIWIAFDMFVDVGADDIRVSDKFETVRRIVADLIVGEGSGGSTGGSKSKQSYCLQQDAPYIYSSFMQEYGIDLIDMQGKLRWEKFIALMSGLRDTTKFQEIIGIRVAKIPTGKGMEEEAKRLRELKRLYALNVSQGSQEEEMNNMFNQYLHGGKIK